MTDLEELKHLLTEADESDPDVDPALYTAFRNALPDLIARVERAEKERDRLRQALDPQALVDVANSVGRHPKFGIEAHGLNLLAELQRIALTGDTPNV